MSDPQAFWNGLASKASHGAEVHTPEAIDKYQSAYFNQQTVHAVSLSLTCTVWQRQCSTVYIDMRRLPRIGND